MIKLRNFGWLLRVGILSSLILPPVIATAQQPLLETIVGIQKADKMGKSIARADVDGDGFMDIIAGAPEGDVYKPTKNGYDDGYVAVFSGDDFEALAVYVGPNEDARLGTSIDRVGDLNGDGTEEIIIGAPGVEKNGTDSGAVYVVSIEPWQYLYQIYGEKQGDNLGHAVAGMGDLNDDGVPDFAYSAPGSDDAMINAGSVYVISGADGSLIRKFNGTSIDDQMGSSLRGIRDLDGDNRLELAVGSHLWDGASKNVGNVSFYNV
ncbi:MAG: FG-GAP repeat protein, partial [Bdellovibrionales bacterium]|nr:FG-GAP repeat protein [Bdellovibrionales bacterium]